MDFHEDNKTFASKPKEVVTIYKLSVQDLKDNCEQKH